MIEFREWTPDDTVVLYQWVTEEPALWQHVGVEKPNQNFAGLSAVIRLMAHSPAAEVRAVEFNDILGGLVAAAPIYEDGTAEPHIILSKPYRGQGREVDALAEDTLKSIGVTRLVARVRGDSHRRLLKLMGYGPPENEYWVKRISHGT